MDDYLPTFRDSEDLFGVKSSKGEMWCSIIEKAYAKYLGSYGKIRDGNAISALRDLFGFPGYDEPIEILQSKGEL